MGDGVEQIDVPCGILGNCVEFVATLISFQGERSFLALTWAGDLPAPPFNTGFLLSVPAPTGSQRCGTAAAAARH